MWKIVKKQTKKCKDLLICKLIFKSNVWSFSGSLTPLRDGVLGHLSSGQDSLCRTRLNISHLPIPAGEFGF